MKVLAAFVVCLLALSIISREIDYILKKSPTYDEYYYVAYGYSLWKTGDYRLRRDKTSFVPLVTSLPLLFLNLRFSQEDEDWIKGDTRNIPKGTPWMLSRELYHAAMFAKKFVHRNTISTDDIIFYARLPIVFISLILGFFVFRWTSELFGKLAGMFSLLLYSSCPNILAHSGLATEDLALSCFVFLTVYFFWKYHKSLKVKYLLFSGIAFGFALNTKYTAVILLPTLVIVSAICYFRHITMPKKTLRFVLNITYVVLIAFLVLLLFYHIFSIKEYFEGMKYSIEYIKRGQMSFLAGRYSLTGFWNYFLCAFLVKTPIPLLLFFVVVLIKTCRNFKKDYKDACFLLVFPILLFISASLSPLQIGHRHILPMYPFLFVFQ